MKGLQKTIYYFLVLTLLMMSAYQVHAEFVSVNPLVKHMTSLENGAAGVIVLPEGNQSGIEGLFFYSSKKIIPAQGFHPNKLGKDAESILLVFDSKNTRRFTEIQTGSGERFSIVGNFKIEVGNLRISIHYENQSEPYVSAVFIKENAALTFLGVQTIFNTAKPQLIALLEPSGGSAVDTFKMQNGGLVLAEQPYKDSKLGLGYGGGSNPCTSNGVLVLPRSQITKILKRNSRDLGTKKNFFAKNTLLLSDARYIVAVDGYGQPIIIKPYEERLIDGTLLCVAEPLSEGVS